MKIICVSNYGLEHVADKLIASNVAEYYVNEIVDFLNEKYSGEHSSNFYRAVKDDYKLWRGMEELV